MKYRESQLLQLLLTNQSMKGQEFSEQLGVSSRTIRSDIQSINQELKNFNVEIQSNHAKGYLLEVTKEDRARLLDFVMQYEDSIKSEPLYRIKRLLLELSANYEVNMYDFSESMFVSESSVQSDIRYLELLFKKNGIPLKIGRRGENIILSGSEEKEILLGLTTALVDGYTELDKAVLLELSIGNVAFKKIRRSVFKVFRDNSLHLSDHEYIFISSYLLVAAVRKHENDIEEFSVSEEKDAVSALISEIMRDSGLSVQYGDMEYLVQLIRNIIVIDRNKIDESSLYSRIKIITKQIDHQYGTTLAEDEEFLRSITNHIDSYIRKNSLNINFSEDVIKEFKNYYPLSYTLAKYLKENIQDLLDRHNVSFLEKEIAFIATHFQASMEKSTPRSKVRVALICSYGIGTMKLLEAQIQREFPNLDIVMTVAAYAQDLIKYNDVDLIITTAPFKITNEIPWIMVDVPLSSGNIESLKKALRSDFYWMKNIYPLLLDIPDEVTTEDQALFYMEEVVNYVENRDLPIQTLLSEREKLLTTNLGHGIAMPHALFAGNLKYHIYFFKHQAGIKWGPSNVRLIAMILINEESKCYLNDYMLKINALYIMNDFNVVQMDEFKNLMDIIN